MAEITQQDVDDFHARERGFKSARDERLHDLAEAVATAKFVVSEREVELQEARDDLASAEKRLRSERRKHG